MWIIVFPPPPYDSIWNRDSFGIASITKTLTYDTHTIKYMYGQNSIADNISKYKAKKASDDLAATAQADLETKKRTAIQDCGATPEISGGPWFSSTYKVGAADEAQRIGLLCVKRIQYVGPAVNPMGGNAARAVFIGYDRQTANPVNVQMDFPY